MPETLTEKITAALECSTVEVEVLTLSVIITSLEHLGFEERERVLRYLVDRYGVGDGRSE